LRASLLLLALATFASCPPLGAEVLPQSSKESENWLQSGAGADPQHSQELKKLSYEELFDIDGRTPIQGTGQCYMIGARGVFPSIATQISSPLVSPARQPFFHPAGDERHRFRINIGFEDLQVYLRLGQGFEAELGVQPRLLRHHHPTDSFLSVPIPTGSTSNAIHAFLTRSWWAEGIPREAVARAVPNSLCFGVFDGEKQIGFARVISDFATYGIPGFWLIDPSFSISGQARDPFPSS
jgi:hypothetical protein